MAKRASKRSAIDRPSQAGAESAAARRQWLWAAGPVLAVTLACVPFANGFPRGHDFIFELVRVAEYRAAWAAGQWPPFWGENLYAGYGSPVFLFYAPAFSALAALFSPVFGGAMSASVAVLVGFTVVSALGAYGMGRAVGGSPAAGRIAAVIFVLHPYVLADKFARNANPEFAALCLAPFAIWGVWIAAERARAGFVLVSLGLAAVILTHNLTALVVLGLVAIGSGVAHGRDARTQARVAAAVGFALALAAFFWVPSFFSTDLVRTEELLSGKFDFRRQWPALTDVFGYAHFFGSGLLGPAIWIAGVVAFMRQRRLEPGSARARLLAVALAASAGFVLLLTPASLWLWETVPLMPLFQFPWRWLGPLALATSLVAALALPILFGAKPRPALEAIVLVAAIANALPQLTSVRPLGPVLEQRIPRLLDPAAVRMGSQKVTVLDEFLPVGADKKLWRSDRPVRGPLVAVSKLRSLDVVHDGGTNIELRIDAFEAQDLRLARWFFPGWRARVGDTEVEVRRSPRGALLVPVPAGPNTVRIWLPPPALRSGFLWVSGASAVLWMAAAWAVGRGARA